jgi:DNA-binding MarR family transcriptional regulator
MTMSTPDPRRVADDAISVAAHLEGELEEALAEHRLTRASFLVLDALEQAPGHALSQRDLVAQVRRTSGTLSVRLGRLERAKVITREPDAENRRRVTVTLTERGAKLVRAARPAYEERAARLVGALGDGTPALAGQLSAWLAFFEPDERVTPRLGVAVAPSAVAARMRRAVGLSDEPGVLVVGVKPDSPAATAGVLRGDLVTQAAGEGVHSVGDLDRAVRAANGRLALAVLRGAEPHAIEVELGA